MAVATHRKSVGKDPLTGKETEVMWVKGSGGDLGTYETQRTRCFVC